MIHLEQSKHDTLQHSKHDTLQHSKHDTLQHSKHDTLEYSKHDTLQHIIPHLWYAVDDGQRKNDPCSAAKPNPCQT